MSGMLIILRGSRAFIHNMHNAQTEKKKNIFIWYFTEMVCYSVTPSAHTQEQKTLASLRTPTVVKQDHLLLVRH